MAEQLEENETTTTQPILTLPEDEDEWYRTSESPTATKKRKISDALIEEKKEGDSKTEEKPTPAIIVMVFIDDSVNTVVKVVAQPTVSPAVWQFLCQSRPGPTYRFLLDDIETENDPINVEVATWFKKNFITNSDEMRKNARTSLHHEADPSYGYYLGTQANFNSGKYNLIGMRSFWGFE